MYHSAVTIASPRCALLRPHRTAASQHQWAAPDTRRTTMLELNHSALARTMTNDRLREAAAARQHATWHRTPSLPHRLGSVITRLAGTQRQSATRTRAHGPLCTHRAGPRALTDRARAAASSAAADAAVHGYGQEGQSMPSSTPPGTCALGYAHIWSCVVAATRQVLVTLR